MGFFSRVWKGIKKGVKKLGRTLRKGASKVFKGLGGVAKILPVPSGVSKALVGVGSLLHKGKKRKPKKGSSTGKGGSTGYSDYNNTGNTSSTTNSGTNSKGVLLAGAGILLMKLFGGKRW